MRSALLAALLLLVSAAGAQMENPVLGEWDWKPLQGVCPERHSYRADGTASTRSGDERLEKRYRIEKLSGDLWRVDAEVLSSNGGKDCLGKPTAVGARSTVFVMPQNFGGYLTCANEDGMSCYGTARPVRKP
jgi:hypothetical protein